MNASINCWDCAYYDGYDVSDHFTDWYCEHGIATVECSETGMVHPKRNCVMFEPKIDLFPSHNKKLSEMKQ